MINQHFQLCLPDAIVLTVTKQMTTPNGRFSKTRLHILHLNNNRLLKIDGIRLIAKQSNASITGIGESKVDSSLLNSAVDTEDYDRIRMDHSRRGDGVACCTPFL